MERQRISSYSVRMLENTDQNNFEYGHFLHSVVYNCQLFCVIINVFYQFLNRATFESCQQISLYLHIPVFLHYLTVSSYNINTTNYVIDS